MQTGRTTRQMFEAPLGALYIWCSVNLHYPRELARSIGRGDLRVEGQWVLENPHTVLGGSRHIVLDHGCVALTPRQQAGLRAVEPYLAELGRLTAQPVFIGVDRGAEPSRTTVMAFSAGELTPLPAFADPLPAVTTAYIEQLVREHRRALADAMIYGVGGYVQEHLQVWVEPAASREPDPRVTTPAYREESLRRESERRRQAQERGQALLKSWLTPEQLAQYDREQAFDVIGSHSKKRYRIHRGRQQNVYELDADGHEAQGWCFTPMGELVAGDCMLAQKIALETDERAALRVAELFGGRYLARNMTVTEVRQRYVEVSYAMPAGGRSQWFDD